MDESNEKNSNDVNNSIDAKNNLDVDYWDEHYDDLSGLYRKKPFSSKTYSFMDFPASSRTQPTKNRSRNEPIAIQPAGKLPKELEEDYYLDYRDGYSRHACEFWDWEYFRRFMEKVKLMYQVVISEFARKFPRIDKSKIPAWVNLNDEERFDLEDIASRLTNAEKELAEQLNKFKPRSVLTYCRRYKPLDRVRRMSAQSWTIYHAMQKDLADDLPIKDPLAFAKAYEKFLSSGLHDASELLTMYRGVKVVKREVNLHVKTDFLAKAHPSADLYADIIGEEMYGNMIELIGGLRVEKYDEIENELRLSLSPVLSTDNQVREIVEIYDEYDTIYKLIYDVNHITGKLVNLRLNTPRNDYFMPMFAYDSTDGSGSYDMYEKCIEYREKICNIIMENKYVNEKIKFDLTRLVKYLTQAIENGRNVHEESYHVDDPYAP